MPARRHEYREKTQLELRRARRDEKKQAWRRLAVDHIKDLVRA